MTDEAYSGEPLDPVVLEAVGRRTESHPLVDGWVFQPDAMSPRRLELRLDVDQYPTSITAARLDIRWFENGDYAFHYVERRDDDRWQCRWDRHPKPDAPRTHFHPPPDTSSDVEPSEIEASHHLGVSFSVLDRIDERVRSLHGA